MSLIKQVSDSFTQARFKEEHRALLDLIGKGTKEKVELYLEKFPQAARWTFGPGHEYTAIHEAVMARRMELIPLFQQYGVDINQPTRNGEPPVCWVHSKDEIGELVALGATMDDPRWHGLTPLMRASIFARADEIEGLLAHGADPHKVINDPQNRFHGQTALQIASSFTDDMGQDDMPCDRQAQAVKLLLAQGGHSVDELRRCCDLAGNWTESAPAGKLLQAALEQTEAAQIAAAQAVIDDAAAEKKAIDNIVHGLPESTTVRRPLVLRKP